MCHDAIGVSGTMPFDTLPNPLWPPTGTAQCSCLVLVDGEHYPTAVADAIAELMQAGWSVSCAVLVGGGEKLRSVPEYGVPHLTAPADDPTPAGALRAALQAFPEVTDVVDLADEPVLVLERRLEMIGIAAGRGLRYRTADTIVQPPQFTRIATPSLAIIGTGKRIGKTAVSAHAARLANHHLGGDGAVVVVAMGRGGPAEPIVVDRADGAVTVSRLLEISRAGNHAASDYLEGAALTGLTTVGCRRVSGGLLGVPAYSNVPAGALLAESMNPALIVLEGSGSCVPTVRADTTLLLASTARPQDLLAGFGRYRIGLADAVLIMGDDRDIAADMVARTRKLSGSDGSPIPVVAASLVPTPVGSIVGRRVAAFTTAPDFVAPLVNRELARAGADVLFVSCNLARREELAHDLARAQAQGADTLVVEIKAAAIDAVAEFADAAGMSVVFLDNVPRPHDPDFDLDGLLTQLADRAVSAASPAG
ncbi:MAG: cyclic 2,3-diphosphoglycerate-synthetase [Thermoleophilia bacterium]|nr:cyclic 2,3-diphosphoglycerate-synthetase [Thermoleophilia bacterium]